MLVPQNEKGFTLIEMLLVMMIVIVVSSVALSFTVKNIQVDQTEEFFRQFQVDMHYLQSYAMAHQKKVRVVYLKDGKEYRGIAGLDNIVLRRTMPEGYLGNTANTFVLQYLPNGNVSRVGALTFHTPEGGRRLKVYIGKGRLQLDEARWDESN